MFMLGFLFIGIPNSFAQESAQKKAELERQIGQLEQDRKSVV